MGVDASGFIAALDRLGASIGDQLDAVAERTATRVAKEWAGRIRRRTGKTAEGITVEKGRSGGGYLAVATTEGRKNVALWLERGTEHITGDPVLATAIALEEPEHFRRITQVIQDGIDAEGLSA